MKWGMCCPEDVLGEKCGRITFINRKKDNRMYNFLLTNFLRISTVSLDIEITHRDCIHGKSQRSYHTVPNPKKKTPLL